MSFIEELRRELEGLRDDERRRIPLDHYGVYALLEHFNLVKYHNSELAWTMNRNHSLPAWRLTVGR